jgi:hypothetical protein
MYSLKPALDVALGALGNGVGNPIHSDLSEEQIQGLYDLKTLCEALDMGNYLPR